MNMNWLRAIFRPCEDAGRVAFLTTRLSNLEYQQENLMARVDELSGIVAEVALAVDAVIAHVGDLEARLAASGTEDPRVGEAVDNLVASRAKLVAAVPAPAPAPEPAPEAVAG
jgi:hypothetical protein